MLHPFSRTELLVGKANLEKLHHSSVAVFGIGGVGSYVVEGLVRAGIGRFALVDNDCVTLTNLNRQLHATYKTIGQPKVTIMGERITDINPQSQVTTIQHFYTPENADKFPLDDYDYVVDAIDTITSKIELILRAQAGNIPIISCMGAGNKLDPTRFQVADIYQTSVCPLAKVMRKELKIRGVKSLKVVYSQELPITPQATDETSPTGKRQIPGSISFVPSVAGLIIASEVVKDLLLDREK